jgi:hypothetical protein
MENRYGMPEWPPTDEEMAQISRRSREERAAVARSIFMTIRNWIVRKPEPQTAIRPNALKAPSYY